MENLETRALLAVRVWDGGGGDANWATAANWNADIGIAAGDDLVFPASGATQLTNNNNLAAGTRFNTILFQGSGYSVSGNPIELSGGLTSNNTTGTNTFGLNTTLINAQTIMTANPGATLNWTGSIDTANIIGNYFLGTMPALVFDGAGTTNVTGAIGGAGSISKLGGGTAILGGNNTYEGITEARQGFLRVSNVNGLGSATTGHTEVQQGAALELSFNGTTNESFVIREGGVGFGSGTDISTAGALRGVGGAGVTSTIAGNVEMVGNNNLIGVSANSTLNISGQILAGLSLGNRRLIKVGAGTLQFTGSQPNVYPGDTQVLQGTLELGKTGAGADKAVPTNLVIGDNIGGDNAARVRLLAPNQISQLNFYDVTSNTVTMNSSGVLDLNGQSDTIGNLILTTGSTYSSDVSTGAGTLFLGGNVVVNTFQGSSGATPAATISGNLDLGSFFSGAATVSGTAVAGSGETRTFTIADTQLANVATDLTISANITGSAGVSWNKAGAGTLRLSGNNSGMAGPIIINGGVVEAGSDTALGMGIVAWVNGSLVATGGAHTLGNPLEIDGTMTFFGSNNLTFTGPATLTAGRTIQVMDPAQTVTFAGAIGEGIFGSQNLTKQGRGTLALTAANTFSGSVTVDNDGGTLALAGNGSILNSTNNLTVNFGATLKIDNNSGGNIDRINDQTLVNLNGHILFVGSSTADSIENIGQLTLNVASHEIEIQNTSSGAFKSILVANALNNPNTDRTLNVVGTGIDVSATGASRFAIVNPNGLTNGILDGALVTSASGGVELGTLMASPEGVALVAYPAAAYVTELDLAGPTSNLKLTTPGTYVLSASRTINSLTLGPGVTLTSSNPNVTLTVNRGMVAFVGSGGATVSVANLVLNNQAAFFAASGMTATVNSTIISTVGTLTKFGPGKVIFTGDNQYTSGTAINEGTLNIQRSTALGSPAGGTTIRPNGALELEQTTFGPVNVGPEGVTVIGTGLLSNVGALRNVAGNNSWMGTVDFNNGSPVVNLLSTLDGFPIVNTTVAFVYTAPNTTLTITGDTGSVTDLAKIGGGTLELAGIISRGTDRNNRILEGTLLLNNEPGVQASRGRYFIGSDLAGAPAATLKLGGSDQIVDDRRVEIFASGLFDLNGNSELIGESNINATPPFGSITLHVAPSGSGKINIGSGGLLTANGDLMVVTVGAGNPAGATITGGTLALQQFGNGGVTRTWQVNDGAVGNDLTVTSTIVNGSGLSSMGLTKSGFGTLELGGTTANTYTGTTTVNEGTLALNKTAGLSAFMGPVTIGDNNVQSGFSGSDVLELRQANQIPDFLALVQINTTGIFKLNGNNETVGVADAQNAIQMQASSTIDLGGATLTINGNLNTNADNGQVSFWTPRVASRIINGTLNLGSIARSLDDNGDRNELPYEIEISANLIGSGGLVKNGSGTVLLSGNNSGLTGDIIRQGGNFAIGSDSAFGSGRLFMNDATIATYGGKRTISNTVFFPGGNTIRLLGGNNTAQAGATNGGTTNWAVGGGGNDLLFTGAVNAYNGTLQISVANAGQVEFAGGIGETYGTVTLRKQGFGTMIISSTSTLSGLEIGQANDGGGGFVRANGGTLILRDNGTYLNTGTAANTGIIIGYGGVLQLDNSGIVLPHRLGDTAEVGLAGGTLALVGKAGVAVSEQMGQLQLRDSLANSYVQSLVPAAAGSSATWRFNGIAPQTADRGAAVQFVGRGTDISLAGPNRIALNTAPALTDAIINYAVLSGSTGLDFVTVTNPTPTTTPFDNFINPLTSGPNFSTTLAGATATTNVKLTSSDATGGTANALLLANGSISVTGGSLTLDSGLLVSNGVGNSVSVGALTLGGANAIVYVNGVNSSLDLASPISAGATSSLASSGQGLLILSGANNYTGVTRLDGGILRATNNTAFGTTAGGVTMGYGATLELSGVNVPPEQLNVAGFGEFNLASVGLRAVGGTTSTWQGNVVLDHNRTAIDVAAGTTLILAGVVSNQALGKTGPGTLQLDGGSGNTFTQDGQQSVIWQGTLALNKAAGTNAIRQANGGQTVTLIVGDNVGGPNAEQLVLLQSNQIPEGSNGPVTVSSSGRFDLGANSETLSGMSLQGGLTGSATVTASTGSLIVNNSPTIDFMQNGGAAAANNGGGGSFGPVTFGGTWNLNAVTRGITVNDLVGVNDVNLAAVLSNGGAFSKDGGGRLTITADNSAFNGGITITNGELVAQHASALGNTTGTTTVNSGFSLLIDGVSIAGEAININGAGFGGQGAIRNLTGNNTWTGAVTLAGGTTIGSSAGTTLDINAAIGGGGNSLTKLLGGTLIFSGGAANTYTGTTAVAEGTLRLNKTAGIDAIAGQLTVGNDSGAQDSDLLILDQDNQINNGVQVQVTPSGRLDLNGKNETIGNTGAAGLNFFLGVTTGPRVTTGAGTLSLAGTVGITTGSAGGIGNAVLTSPGAIISGNLNLGNVSHTLTVPDLTGVIRELQIDATINGGGANGTFTTTGAGITYLTADNSATLSATTTLSAGNLALGNSNALGSGSVNITGAMNLFFPTYGAAPTTITVPNAITLNADLTLRGDNNFNLSGIISGQGAANRTLNVSLNNASVAALSGTINPSNDTTIRTFIINTNTFNHALTMSANLTSGTGMVHNFQKGGNGTLIVSNNNTAFDGIFTVALGIVRPTNDGAFGSTIGNTIVNTTGRIELTGGRNMAESLFLNANAQGFFVNTGALENTSGNNTWSGLVSMSNGTQSIGVDAGTLTITGAMVQNPATATFLKLGDGTLELGGVYSNNYGGTTTVRQGTLVLNKIPGQNAFAGGLTVGDEGGGPGADQVILKQANQFPNNQGVTVTSTGLFDVSQATQGFLGSTALNEVQLITYSAVATLGGTFTITFGGFTAQTTGALAYNASVATVQSALDTLLNTTYGFAAGSAVQVSGSPGAYVLTFTGPLANANLPAMTVTNTNMTALVTTLRDGIGNEVQTFPNTAFTPSYNGVSGTAVAANATATTVLGGITTIPGFTTSNTVVIGASGGTLTAIFNGNLSGANLLQFGGASATTTNAIGVETQHLRFTALPTTGTTYRLEMAGVFTNITFNPVTALTDLQAGLDSMFGAGSTLVLGPATAATNSDYTIVFRGDGAFGTANLPLLNARPSTGTISMTTNAPTDGVTYSELQSLRLTGAGNEVQTVALSGTGLGGTFNLIFGANTTANINFNASAQTVQTELEKLPSIGMGNVFVTGSSGGSGGTYAITFQGALGNTDVAPLNFTSALTGTTPAIAVNTPTPGVPLGGTYTLSFGATAPTTTGPLNVTDSAATIQSALAGLGDIGAGNVRVVGSSSTAGGSYLVLFAGAKAKTDVATLTANTSLLTGTTPAVTPVAVLDGGVTGNEVQSLTLAGNGFGGFFTLTYNNQVTAPIPAGASAAIVQAALEAIGTVQAGNIQVTAVVHDSSTTYYFSFRGVNRNQDATALTAQTGNLTTITTSGTSNVVATEAAGFATATINADWTLRTGPNSSASVTTGDNVLYSIGANFFVTTFGATTGANPAATYAGNLSINASGRNLQVNDTFIPNEAEDILFSGVLSGPGSFSLSTAGSTMPGTAAFTNSNNIAAGAFTVNGGNVLLLRNSGTLLGASGFTINGGTLGQGVLVLDNSTTNANRIGDAATVSLAGGMLSFLGNASVATTETVGVLNVNTPSNTTSTIQSTAGAAGQALTFTGAMTRQGGGSLNFVGVGADLGSANNKVFFSGVNEQQTVAVTGRNLGGSYTLTFNGQTTTAIAFNAPATGVGSVQAALEALSTIGVGNVSVAAIGAPGVNGSLYVVTFQGSLATANVASITLGSSAGLTGTNPTVNLQGSLPQLISGQNNGAGNEIQHVTYAAGITGGSYLLNLGGVSFTQTFSAATLRADLQFAVEQLVGAGNVTVVGPASYVGGAVYSVIFTGGLTGTNVPNMTVFTTNILTGGSISVSAITDGVINNSLGGTPTLVNATLGYATLTGFSGLDFVTQTANGITAAPFVPTLAAATPASNVKLSASEAFTGSKTINGLMLSGNNILVSGGTSLQLRTGELINTGGSNTISTPVRYTGADALYLIDPGSTAILSGAISTTINEVQTVTIGGNVATFSLTFPTIPGVGGGGTTAAITRSSATGDEVQRALQAIPALAGNVTVTGGGGGAYTITFINALAGINLPIITGTMLTTAAGNTTVTAAETTRGGALSPIVSEDQTLTVGQGVTALTLAYNAVNATPLTYVAGTTSATDILNNLNTIPALAGNVSVSGPVDGPFVITFIGALAGQDVIALTVAPTGGSAVIAETAKGGANIAAAPAVTVRKEFAGTLVLSGDNTDFVTAQNTTTLTVNQGAVTVANSTALGRLAEEQTIILGGTLTGTFTITFNGQTTTPLIGNTVTAATLQAALESLSTIGAGNIRVDQFAGPTPSFRVWFQGNLLDQNVSQFTSNVANGVTVSHATPRDGQSGQTLVHAGAAIQTQGNLAIGNESLDLRGVGVVQEIQTLSLTGATAGSFTLTYAGQTTSSLPFNATAAQVQIALNALSSLGGRGGNVSVTRRDRGAGNVDFLITFGGQFSLPLFGLDVSPITATPTGLGASATTTNSAGGMIFGGGSFFAAANGTGALRNLSGTSTWGIDLPSTVTPGSTLININTNPIFFGVDAGQLNLNAAVTNNNNEVKKVGGGTLEYRGMQANNYNQTTTVLGGTLNLNKQSNSANASILAGLVIGDDTGDDNSDRVVIMTHDQIANNQSVTVNRSGQLSVNVSSYNEVQSIAYTADAGSFTLTLAGMTTGAIAFNSPASGAGSVQAALEALPSVGVGNVTVTGAPGNYSITFGGTLANANLPQMSAKSSLTNVGNAATITAATTQHGFGNEVQTITLASGGLSGSFTVNFQNSAATNNVAIAATGAAGNLQAALAALSNVGAGNLQVIGPDSSVNGGVYYVIFRGTLANLTMPNIAVANGTLANGGAQYPAIGVAQAAFARGAGNEGQTLTLSSTFTSGQYRLLLGDQVSGEIFATDTAATIESVLAAMPNIGPGNVRVLSGNTGTGAVYQVFFTGALANVNVPTLALINNVVGGGTVAFATTHEGGSEDIAGLSIIEGNVDVTAGSSFTTTGLTVQGGSTSGAGVINLTGNVTYNSGLQTTLGSGFNLVGAQRTITVNDGKDFNDVVLTGTAGVGSLIGAAGGWSKAQNGTLLVNGTTAIGYTGLNSVQSFAITSATGTTQFTVTLNGIPSRPVLFDPLPATAASNLRTALEAMLYVGAGNVDVQASTTGAAGQMLFLVRFKGALAAIDVGALTVAITTAPGTASGVTANVTGRGTAHTAGFLAIGNNAALGTVPLTVSGGTIWASGADRSVTTPLAISGNFTAGGRRDFGGTFDLDFTTGAPRTLLANTTITVDDPQSLITVSGTISENAFNRTVTKGGVGTLILSGANTYSGAVTVSTGILRLKNNDALGLKANELVYVQDTGSAFTLTFGGFTTTSIPTGSAAATVAAALNALPSIGGSNGAVSVTGTGVINTTTFDPFVVEFQGFLAGTDVAAVTAAGATVLALNRNGSGTTVANNAELQLDGSLTIGDEALNYNGLGFQGRTSSASVFVGSIHEISGSSTWGTGRTPIQNAGGNGQVNYVGADAPTSLVLNGTIFQPTGLPGGQFTNLNKVGGGALEMQGTVGNTYGSTIVLDGSLILNKAPGVNATGFFLGTNSQVTVGDNVGGPNADLLILKGAEQIPDGSVVLVTGSGQVRTTATQAASLTNEVQQIQIGNAALAGQYRLQFNGVSTVDIASGASFAQIQAALNALSTIGGVGGGVFVTGNGTGQNNFYTVTFLGSLAGANQPALKVVAGTTPYSGATVAVTTIAQGGIAGRETIGAPTLRLAPQAAGNILLDGGSTLALNGDLTVDNYGGLFATATTSAMISGGTLELRPQSATGNAANRNFNVNADGPAVDDLVITARMAEGAQGSISALNKGGAANSRMVIGTAFASTFTGNVTVSSGNLTAVTPTAFGSIQTDEVQSYVINNVLGNASGTYVINTDLGPTGPIAFNASAEEVQAAINLLYGAGSVQVVNTVNGNTNIQYFIHWLAPVKTVAPIATFTPDTTTTTNAALSYPDVTTLDAANGPVAGQTNFEGLWSGSLIVSPADPLTWSFGTSSDDGSVILIDLNGDGFFSPAERIVNNGGSHGTQPLNGTVTFPAAGTYKFAIAFFQGTNGGAIDARFAKAGGVAYLDQTVINPSVQPGMWLDDAAVADQFTVKWYNRTPVATDIDPSVTQITLNTASLVNATAGTITTHQEGGQSAGTTVNGGALELRSAAGMTVANENLTLNGTGIINGGLNQIFNSSVQAAVGTGALRNEIGNNVWQGNISGQGNVSIANNPTAIGVTAGSLTFNGLTSQFLGGGSLLKTGTGTLELGGNGSDLNSGNTYVQQGTLLLNKTGSNIAINAAEVYIGDSVGGANADVIRYGASAGNNQIANLVLHIASSGQLDFNGIADSISNTVFLDSGITSSASITTGGATYLVFNTITSLANAGQTAASPPAIIAGNINLQNAVRTFDIKRGLAPVALDIQAFIDGGGAAGAVTKNGQGRLRLSNNNNYDGTTTINAGVIEVGAAGALGTTVGGTTVPNSTALEFNSASSMSIGETLTIGGDGYDSTGTGVLNNVGAGGVTLTGPINLSSGSTARTVTIGNASAGTTLTIQPDLNLYLVTIADGLVFTGNGNITLNGKLNNGQTGLLEGYIAGNFNLTTANPGTAGPLGPGTGGLKLGPLAGNSLADGSPYWNGDNITWVYTGQFFDADGVVSFAESIDDSTFLRIDGLVRIQDTAWNVVTGSGILNLGMGPKGDGWHDIEIRFGEGGGGAGPVPTANQTPQQPGWTNVKGFGINNAGTASLDGGNYVVPLDAGDGSLFRQAQWPVVKNGAGVLTINSDNTGNFTGPITANAGTLRLANAAGSAAGAGSITIQSGATLDGTGGTAGPVTVNSGGTLSPGIPGATATAALKTGNLTLAAGSNYAVQLNGAVAGTGYDQTVITGAANVTGATLQVTSSVSPAFGQVFVIGNNDTEADATIGLFATLAELAPINIGGLTYHVTYKYNATTNTLNTGNDIAIIRNQVPIANAGGPYTINEGSGLVLAATASDPDSDTITVRWDIDGDGLYSENITGISPTLTAAQLAALGLGDGPATRTMHMEVKDAFDGITTIAVGLTVNNVNPTTASPPPATANVNEGSGAFNISLAGAIDPSPADAAGLRYAYDLNGSGVYGDGPGEGSTTYASALTTNTAVVPASTFTDGFTGATKTIKSRIIDKDGGFTEYTTVITIANVAPVVATPPASSASGAEGTSFNISLIGPSDPSPVDTTAGFRYAFDLNGSGIYGDFPGEGSTSYAGALLTNSATVPLLDGFPGATQTVKSRIIDKDGGFTEYTTVLTITNVDPTATTPPPAAITVNEGVPYALTIGGPTDASPVDAASLHFAFDLNGSGVYGDFPGEGSTSYAAALTSNVGLVPIDDGFVGATKTVKSRVIDKDGGFTEYTTVITIANVKPTVMISGPSIVVPGVPANFLFTTTDPSSADMAAGFKYTINWGDVSQTTPVGQPAVFPISHTYGTMGNFTISVTATDKDGGVSVAGTFNVSVRRFFEDADGNLVFGGENNGADKIVFSNAGTAVVATHTVNSKTTRYTITPTHPNPIVIAYGQGMNDDIRAQSGFLYAVQFHGGAGNDYLAGGNLNDTLYGDAGNDTMLGGVGDDSIFGDIGNDSVDGGLGNDSIWGGDGNDTLGGNTGDDFIWGGLGIDKMSGALGDDYIDGGDGNDSMDGGAGNDILLGGAGNDTLNGSGGMDLIVGGAGLDAINGGADDDILIGDNLVVADPVNDLLAIRNAWTAGAANFGQRVDDMLLSTLAMSQIATDGQRETIVGGAGQDWFLTALTADRAKDFAGDERLNDFH